MHGDFDHVDDLVITKEDYDRYLEGHPVIATHLASMLITRTALFLGYSLRDPNFLQIKDVISKRLGQFERKSYIASFNVTEKQIKEYDEKNLYVINLKSNLKSKAELLLDFQKQVYDYTTFRSVERTCFLKEEDSVSRLFNRCNSSCLIPSLFDCLN